MVDMKLVGADSVTVVVVVAVNLVCLDFWSVGFVRWGFGLGIKVEAFLFLFFNVFEGFVCIL